MRRSSYRFCIVCGIIGTLVAAALLLWKPAQSFAQQTSPKPGKVSFIRDIAPIFKENCLACHDAKKRKGKLYLGSYESFRKGGTKGDPIVPGKPDESYVLDLLTATDNSRMPPRETGDALPADKVKLIGRWIAEGAQLDAGLSPGADLLKELRARWQPPMQPEVYPYPVSITSLCFTPDGKKLVVGGQHELTVWSVPEGKLVQRVHTRAERAYAMAFLPDGLLAVAGGRPGQEGDVCIYDLEAPASKSFGQAPLLDGVNDPKVLVKRLQEADDSVLCLALSHDGKKLAAAGCDRIISVWNISGGVRNAKLDQMIENHADWVFGLAFAPDGKHLLTASRDKTAKVWDLVNKESVITFPDHQQTVYAVAVRPDGKMGISVGEDNQLRIWNAVGEGKQVRNVGGHGKAVFRVVPHPKEPLLISCSADGSVRIWKTENGQPVRTLTGHSDWVYAVAVSGDGATLASGDWNGEVRLWNFADGKLKGAFVASPGYHKDRKDEKTSQRR